MSTRCQLRFIDAELDRVAQIYRHSDGYPRSVIQNLQHVRELLRSSGAQRDASYTAAQFLFIDKLWSLERSLGCRDGIYSELPESVSGVLETDGWQEIATTPTYLLGHGVENPSDGIHGDEEFLYVVELPARNPTETSAEWKVKISEHCGFPRWEGPTEEAFEVVDWQFSGTLTEAVAEVDSDA